MSIEYNIGPEGEIQGWLPRIGDTIYVPWQHTYRNGKRVEPIHISIFQFAQNSEYTHVYEPQEVTIIYVDVRISADMNIPLSYTGTADIDGEIRLCEINVDSRANPETYPLYFWNKASCANWCNKRNEELAKVNWLDED